MLYPVLSARGHITYGTKDHHEPTLEKYPRNALLTRQGRSEPIRVQEPDPEAENIRRLEREVQLRVEQRDLLVDQDMRRKARVSERLRQQQEKREWQQSLRAQRNQERQDDAMRHERERQTFNDGFRELMRTQEQTRQQQQELLQRPY